MLLVIRPKRDKQSSSKVTSLASLPASINKKQSHYAQQMSKNKGVIALVVAKAREQGEIPVRQQVLREIRFAQPKSEPSCYRPRFAMYFHPDRFIRVIFVSGWGVGKIEKI